MDDDDEIEWRGLLMPRRNEVYIGVGTVVVILLIVLLILVLQGRA